MLFRSISAFFAVGTDTQWIVPRTFLPSGLFPPLDSGSYVAYVEPELEKYDKEDSFQFKRTGYFCLDSKDSTKEHKVFKRIVSLKSSYKPN